jgi:hypothetical protein
MRFDETYAGSVEEDMNTNELIGHLRAQAKHYRELAKGAREAVRNAKERKDWVAKLQAECRVTEYVREAQGCDARVKELRT